MIWAVVRLSRAARSNNPPPPCPARSGGPLPRSSGLGRKGEEFGAESTRISRAMAEFTPRPSPPWHESESTDGFGGWPEETATSEPPLCLS